MTTTRDAQASEVVLQQGGDVLLVEHAEGEALVKLASAPSYDYGAQWWRETSDHAHVADESGRCAGALLFCGADLATCSGLRS